MAQIADNFSGNRAGRELQKFRRAFPLMVRAAMERTFWVWLRTFGPRRFAKNSYFYYKQLSRSYKRGYTGDPEARNRFLRILAQEIRQGKNTPNPLVKSGELKQQFLHGTIIFTGGRRSGRLRATWGSLPNEPFKRKINQIDVAEALTEIPESENTFVHMIFDKFLQKEINKHEHRFSGGRYRL